MQEAHTKAHEIFSKYFDDLEDGRLISNIITGIANGQCTFFIAPDGSKEGWSPSDNADSARAEFVKWLKNESDCDFVEVRFGGDDNASEIINSGN